MADGEGRTLGEIIREALPVANLQILPETIAGAQLSKRKRGEPQMCRVTFVTDAVNLTPGEVAYPATARNVGIVIWVPRAIYEKQG